MKTIELDVAFEDPQDATLAAEALARRYDVSARKVADRGPGGWPVFEFAGRYESMKIFLTDAYDLDIDEVS